MPELPELPQRRAAALRRALVLALGLLAALCFSPRRAFGATTAAVQDTVVVGSKNFTESGVLAELIAQMLEEHTELKVERRLGLGGTMICWTALEAGEIDLYAEYTGTAWATILKQPGKITDPLRAFLLVRRGSREQFGVEWLEPFGFENTYALALREDRAQELGVQRISDLLRYQQQIRAGFSIEFLNREDGYLGLASTYGLNLDTRSMEHALAYPAIDAGSIDLMDAYSTDGKLLRHSLRVLEDDRSFFPPYHAAPLVRRQTLQRHPEIESALAPLTFAVSATAAQALNDVVESEGQRFADVARAFLEHEGLVEGRREEAREARAALERALSSAPGVGAPSSGRPGLLERLGARGGRTLSLILEHLALTLIAVALATVVAVPLGVLITRVQRLRTPALALAGVVQTIPSLALLAFMIPLLGLDVKAAIAALFLYAVLPILRNTDAGIMGVDPDLIDAARGMGLRPREVLTRIELPLALRTIMAGIRTSTVISLGVATLAAFIGAGGLGEPIVEGLYLNDSALILSGAIPAALLAILADLGLGRLERWLQTGPQSSPSSASASAPPPSSSGRTKRGG